LGQLHLVQLMGERFSFFLQTGYGKTQENPKITPIHLDIM